MIAGHQHCTGFIETKPVKWTMPQCQSDKCQFVYLSYHVRFQLQRLRVTNFNQISAVGIGGLYADRSVREHIWYLLVDWRSTDCFTITMHHFVVWRRLQANWTITHTHTHIYTVTSAVQLLCQRCTSIHCIQHVYKKWYQPQQTSYHAPLQGSDTWQINGMILEPFAVYSNNTMTTTVL